MEHGNVKIEREEPDGHLAITGASYGDRYRLTAFVGLNQLHLSLKDVDGEYAIVDLTTEETWALYEYMKARLEGTK